MMSSKTKEDVELVEKMRRWRATKVVPSGYKVVPPDGGYGWIVIVGSFIITTMISVPPLVFGIILKDMVAYTGSTNAQASWTVSIALAVSQFIGPLCTVSIFIFSTRTTAFVGGIIAALGLFLSAFAQSIQFLYFSFGVLTGIGMGLSRVPCFVVASQYFQVKFGIAAGIIFAGFGCGRLLFSPICQHALDTYGFQGTFIIVSGICLNACVGAVLFQPVQRYLVLKKIEEPKTSPRKPEIELKAVKSKIVEDGREKENNSENKYVNRANNMRDVEEQKGFLSGERQDEINRARDLNYLASAISCESVHQVVVPPQAVSPPPVAAAQPPKSRLALFKKMLLNSLDFNQFRSPLFYLICFSGVLSYLTILYSNVFLFPLAIDRGLTPSQASWVVTAKAAAEITGRLGFPWIQKVTPIDAVLFYVIICALVGFCLLAQSLVVSFAPFMVVAILTGAVTGGTVVQNASVTLMIVGAAKYPSVVGLCSFVQSIFALLAGPLIGYIRDLTGSFVDCYLLIMGLQFLGGLMWFCRYIYVICCVKPPPK